MKHPSSQHNAVVAVFARHQDAEEAVRKLASGGFDMTRFMRRGSTPRYVDEAYLSV